MVLFASLHYLVSGKNCLSDSISLLLKNVTDRLRCCFLARCRQRCSTRHSLSNSSSCNNSNSCSSNSCWPRGDSVPEEAAGGPLLRPPTRAARAPRPSSCGTSRPAGSPSPPGYPPPAPGYGLRGRQRTGGGRLGARRVPRRCKAGSSGARVSTLHPSPRLGKGGRGGLREWDPVRNEAVP